MKVYFAGISGNKIRLDYLKRFGAKRLMLTYAEKNSYNKQMSRFKEGNFELFFDSGAFSAWKRNLVIDIDSYCYYLKFHNISQYIVLDVVKDHFMTLINQKIMEDCYGMRPIPVYHLGSQIQNLFQLIELGYNYIALGGTVGSTYDIKMSFFDQIFRLFPNHKFHGLGVTDTKIVKNFPFYSIDSTTWLIAQKVNKIFDENGKQCNPPFNMSTIDKFRNTIEYFIKLENFR